LTAALNFEKTMALVTGGAGFVGSHVVDALVVRGAKVRVLDNLTRGGQANLAKAQKTGRLDFVSGDLRDEKIWNSVLSGVDIVFHEAALRVNRCEEDPQECWDTMVTGTLKLLQACVAHRVKKIVLASSAIVYGASDTLPTPESSSVEKNTTWYGMAKLANEQMLNVFYAHDRLPGVALRYFNIYGPRMATQGHTEVLVKWLEAAEAGKPVRILGDGSQTMDWVHVQDVALANLLVAEAPAMQGVFNVGTGVETSLLDLARTLLRLLGKKEEPECTRDAPLNPIPRRWADVSKAARFLNYHSRIALEEGLSDMIQWWKTR
jgi:UDP-glucose 4-epimerase